MTSHPSTEEQLSSTNDNQQLFEDEIDFHEENMQNYSKNRTRFSPNVCSANDILKILYSQLTSQLFSTALSSLASSLSITIQQQRLSVSNKQSQQNFHPYNQLKTLNSNNQISQRRLSILPIFPTTDPIKKPPTHLLLPNVPVLSLSMEQFYNRDHWCDNLRCRITTYNNCPFSQLARHLYELFLDMSRRLRVNMAIIIVNFTRMLISAHQFILTDFVDKLPSLSITTDEWMTALGFYLEMDVNLFFLKTCSFRGSRPRPLDYITYILKEGLFCMDPPEARYGMKQCQNRKCLFCHLPNQTNRLEPALSFSNNQIHTFQNQYQVILNCDVTCTSTKVIYALTCPCHQFDYVGRTNGPFYKRLYFHRRQCYRIIKEFLLGEAIVNRMNNTSKTDLILNKDRMDLYRHLVRCPIAMQMFLDCQSIFWCLVPMSRGGGEEAAADKRKSFTQSTDYLLWTYQNSNSIENEDIKQYRSDTDVDWCIEHLPKTPLNYCFSEEQRKEQYFFFKSKADLWPIPHHIDLYNASIVMALPENSSDNLLHFVQALLATHTESKLNTTIQKFPSHFDRHDDNWCRHLICTK